MTPYEEGYWFTRLFIIALGCALVGYFALRKPKPNPAFPNHFPLDPHRDLAQRAARASWLFTVGGMVFAGGTNGAPRPIVLIASLAGLSLMVAAIAAGIFALSRLPKVGSKGVLIPAIIGLSLNALLVLLALSAIG